MADLIIFIASSVTLILFVSYANKRNIIEAKYKRLSKNAGIMSGIIRLANIKNIPPKDLEDIEE